MKLIKTVPNSSPNEATVGEVYLMEGIEQEVTSITSRLIFLNHRPFNKNLFNYLVNRLKHNDLMLTYTTFSRYSILNDKVMLTVCNN